MSLDRNNRGPCPLCATADALWLFRHEVACHNWACPNYAADLAYSDAAERDRKAKRAAWWKAAGMPTT